MNQLSLTDFCYLFCCPPIPSRIAAKLAFLPPEPTYEVVDEEDGTSSLHLTDRSEWQYSHRELDSIEVFHTCTQRNNRICCMYVHIKNEAKYTILFSHGNAVDLGQMACFYVALGTRIGCNIFSYDYSGYGTSTGKPSEANIYADIEAAMKALNTRYNIRTEEVILYGQSIGTVPSIDLATRHNFGGIILHSPLLSGMRVAFPETRRTWFFDPFPSIDKINRVQSPVLFIHGTEDEVIDFTHGVTLFNNCPNSVEPLWVQGAGHNDVELFGQYLERLRKFIDQDLIPPTTTRTNSGANISNSSLFNRDSNFTNSISSSNAPIIIAQPNSSLSAMP